MNDRPTTLERAYQLARTGAYESAAGHVIADFPRPVMTPRRAANDAVATAVYERVRPTFGPLTRRAAIAVVITLAVFAMAYLWNARTLE